LVEQNTELLEIVEHNWNILGRKAKFINQKLEDFLNENKETFDVIYLDPAEETTIKIKSFFRRSFADIIEIQEKLLSISIR
jgi:16S rRNA G966 N2-methylase RsmD